MRVITFCNIQFISEKQRYDREVMESRFHVMATGWSFFFFFLNVQEPQLMLQIMSAIFDMFDEVAEAKGISRLKVVGMHFFLMFFPFLFPFLFRFLSLLAVFSLFHFHQKD